MEPAALRSAGSVFSVSVKVTAPAPLRPVPSTKVRKGLLVSALQAQPGWVVIVTVPVAAAAVRLMLVGLTE